MFNLLVTANPTAWETDQLMRIDKTRLKEYSDAQEAENIRADKPETLAQLEGIPTLLMYETGTEGPQSGIVRYGLLRSIRVTGKDLSFYFDEEGRFDLSTVEEFADRLGLGKLQLHRTHWAIKEGGIPTEMMRRLTPSYDVVLSFAGENRSYVEEVARFLHAHGVKVFYDSDEEVQLWGKDLAEHFGKIYGGNATFCVMFISEQYAEKQWTRHERRTAVARALGLQHEYILPIRFDDTVLPAIPNTMAYVSAKQKTPEQIGEMILRKLGRGLK